MRRDPPAHLPGSSPREWGTLPRTLRLYIVDRFIPTRVGNTSAPASGWRPQPVHPHASGEHIHNLPEELKEVGSSPREWGTLDALVRQAVHTRFIPTRVGNTVMRCV